MSPRFGFALIAGFGSMMVLTAILGFSQIRRTSQSQTELMAAQESYSGTEALLSEMRADLYRINIDVRDYLLDRNAANAADLKQQVVDSRERMLNSLFQLEKRLGHAVDADTLAKLRDQVEDYIAVLRPPLEWTPDVKAALAGSYTRNLLTRRRQISDLAARLQAINIDNLRQAERRLEESQAEFRYWLRRLTYGILFLSALVAGLSVWWIVRLERRARNAERALRNLSQKLVRAQEEERKALSLELHDQVGQMLTALKVEISNLGRIGNSDPERFQTHVRQAKEVAEGAMKTVRDLAMGLRPSMLDDLGLGPAIGWQAREFSRVSGVPANVQVDGSLEGMTESQKTGLFRVIQEALTNITRHASASEVNIRVQAEKDRVRLTIRDNGKGMDLATTRRMGLGMLGMEERIREMDGDLQIESEPGRGTEVKATIPRKNA